MTSTDMTSGSMSGGGSMTSSGHVASNGMRRDEGSMTSPPKDWRPEQQQQAQQTSNEDKPSFFNRLFFQEDMRLIANKLQSMGMTKTDLIQSNSFIVSDYGFFLLHFQMLPVIAIAIHGIFISMSIFFLFSKLSIVLGGVLSFLFLQFVIYLNAEIVYSLDQYKLGEKETGRFIMIVKRMWHFIEMLLFMFIALLGILYAHNLDYRAIAQNIIDYQIGINFFNKLFTSFKESVDLIALSGGIQESILALFATFSFFMLTYIIAVFIVHRKHKNKFKENQFEVKKEFLNPADLAREKFEF